MEKPAGGKRIFPFAQQRGGYRVTLLSPVDAEGRRFRKTDCPVVFGGEALGQKRSDGSLIGSRPNHPVSTMESYLEPHLDGLRSFSFEVVIDRPFEGFQDLRPVFVGSLTSHGHHDIVVMLEILNAFGPAFGFG